MPKKKNKHKALTIKKPVITFIVTTIILLSMFLFWNTIIWPAVKTCIGCAPQPKCASAVNCHDNDDGKTQTCQYYDNNMELSKDTIICDKYERPKKVNDDNKENSINAKEKE